uniref:SAC3/GANP/THP3 conserved domain-containing protein n=1 Tax=Parascaris univalens TaxID=6257 RepID=A0A914ZL89_PARUN
MPSTTVTLSCYRTLFHSSEMFHERPKALCMQMCPQSEIRFRKRNGLVHILETDTALTRTGQLRAICAGGGNQRRLAGREGNPLKMVKQYSRSAAGKEKLSPTELRPFGVLMDTVAYLLRVVSEYDSREAWPDVYEFVSDRLRAIRQDMIVENLDAEKSILLLESMIPFYAEAEYRCEMTRCPTYDRKLHATQLEECFCRWRQFVDFTEPKNERIMASYLMHNADKRWVLVQLIAWKEHFCKNNYTFIQDVILSLRMNNFVRFFRLISQQEDSILRLTMTRHFATMRLLALRACAVAYRCRGIPLPGAFLEKHLHMKHSALLCCLRALGCEVLIRL